ncbi:23S rRNA (uracil-5-)-methyltransferase RumA [Lactobacillus selangorensis]|uniref:23S rRNA (Uracil-5-)-methyltransferase RumA n=1 Tax=Lactobacillus selangorensis TaxID=81857 RepID=A0A0R2FFJ0_9LACO|nr:23S rRNA (uracil(1939)-C(5))-methyltransferase RlmD [Lactobacillus selangorensis]KRN27264.1 23S rRNA (uracil-5-)-methyltransferase RumA [Lactobacillus selangorensis]KRN29953.1 23S rRNA (uracil-5-)-methyltransferase RumA [Lactobacillus selangorensis]
MKVETPVHKNDVLTVRITDLTYAAQGVAKIEHYPLFIENALPGEEVEIKVTKVNKTYGFARVTKYIKVSEDRVAVAGREFTQTGIAPLQHLAYPAQLKFKQQQIENLYQKAHLDIPVAPTLGMQNPTGYRNKAQVPVRMVHGQLTTGFYKPHSHDLVPMENFFIQDPAIDHAIVVVRDILRQFNIEPYHEEKNSGVIRHIMVRRGYYSHETMIVLITKTKKLPHAKEIVTAIQNKLPEVVSIMHNVNLKATNVILGPHSTVLAGKSTIRDTLLGLQFDISAQSFYQVNPTQAERLYRTALDQLHLTGQETVIDAYSGIGTISLLLAREAKQVYGVEIVAQAVEDAKHNAKLNHIDNAQFTLGPAEDVIQKWKDDDLKVDALVVDPPRKGLAASFIDAVAYLKPQQMIYISCNPATLARDLVRLQEAGYTAKSTRPVDMFPQTQHVESVTVLERAEK